MRGITRYVDELLRSRRPRRFRASGEDARLARAAVTLRAARPGGAARDEFVTALHKRLAAELDPPGPASTVRRRRAFLRSAAIAAGAAVGGGIDHQVTARTRPGTAPAAAMLTPSHGTWKTLASSADLPEGAVRPFTVGALTGFVERSGGTLRAVSGICTHQGCRLTLGAPAARLVCPCHGATFALDGSVLSHHFTAPLAPLSLLAVREADGVIQVYAPLSHLPSPGPGPGSASSSHTGGSRR
jgi:cytochrome b6-f complex iron-sulfur subunit